MNTNFIRFKTTTLGSFPKPQYVPVPDWFGCADDSFVDRFTEFASQRTALDEALITRGAREIIRMQQHAGIDLVTDGEVARDDYILSFLRPLSGVSFSNRRKKTMRAGTWTAHVPTVDAPLFRPTPCFSEDYLRAAPFASSQLKMTLPGPLTLTDTVYNEHYPDDASLCQRFAELLVEEIQSLVLLGCRYIQIDEPLLLRRISDARAFGFDCLKQIVTSVSGMAHLTLHVCCGYPDTLDNPDFEHAAETGYSALATELDALGMHALSLEHARCGGSLEFLQHITLSSVVLGVVSIAHSRIESLDEVNKSVQEALQYIDKERLILSPDCGMGMLPRNVAAAKLQCLGKAGQELL